MTIVVEDGTGKTNAESYATVEVADAYHVAFGNTAWADLDTADKEAALRKATRYMEGHYRFSGSKQTAEQALLWPRIGATRHSWLVDESSVPLQVQHACAELALQSLTTDLAATGSPHGAVIQEQVDVLSVTYAEGRSGATEYRAADQLLAGLVIGGSTMKVYRS